jgi:hypothetical protein
MSQVFIGNGRARLPERLDDSGNLECVPYQDGVGYQAQAARFIHDLLGNPPCGILPGRRKRSSVPDYGGAHLDSIAVGPVSLNLLH